MTGADLTAAQARTVLGRVIDCGPRLGPCKVLVVHPAGTIDVMARSGRCYRVSGLTWKAEPSPTGAALLSVLS